MARQSGSFTWREVDGAMTKMPAYREAKLTLVRPMGGHRLLSLLLDFSATASSLTQIFTTGIWRLLLTVMVPPLVAMCKPLAGTVYLLVLYIMHFQLTAKFNIKRIPLTVHIHINHTHAHTHTYTYTHTHAK